MFSTECLKRHRVSNPVPGQVPRYHPHSALQKVRLIVQGIDRRGKDGEQSTQLAAAIDKLAVNGTAVSNQLYLCAGILAHNLTRELQMQLYARDRGTTVKRAALWCFREIETLRRLIAHLTLFGHG
jgi:hypothetical protein